MNTEIIEDFLEGRLSEEMKIQVNERLKTDSMFAEEVAFVLATKQYLFDEQAKGKKAEWKKRYRSDSRGIQLPLKPNRRPWAYVATLASAACLLFVIYQAVWVNSPSADAYVLSYVEKNHATISVQMGEMDNSFDKAVELYNTKEYTKAIEVLKQAGVSSKTLEYKGLAEFQLKKYSEALITFQQLEQIEDSMIKKAPYFQAITLVMMKRESEAKTILQKISDSNNLFGQKEAKELLEAMD